MKRKLVALTLSLTLVLGASLTTASSPAHADRASSHALPFDLYVNDQPLKLKNAYLQQGTTYVPLRAFAEALGCTVSWENQTAYRMPIPGGYLPNGINIIDPTAVTTVYRSEFDSTHHDKKPNAVNISTLFLRNNDSTQRLYFTYEGLMVDGKLLPCDFLVRYQQIYVTLETFEKTIQPHLVALCTQDSYQAKQTKNARRQPVFINASPVTLSSLTFKNNQAYASLRELTESLKGKVLWTDPQFHTLPSVGGNAPQGITVLKSTNVSTRTLPIAGKDQVMVDITALYRANQDEALALHFIDKVGEQTGLVVNGQIQPMNLVPFNDLLYVSVDDFTQVIQPHLLALSLQHA